MKNLTVTQPELARIFDVSIRTVQRWGPQGLDDVRIDPEAAIVRYDLPKAVAWRLEDEARRWAESQGGKAVDLEKARARKEVALAQLRELELAEKRGETIHLDDVETLDVEYFAKVRAWFLSAPGRIAAVLPMDAVKAVELIEPLVFELMDELAEAGEEADAA